MKPLVTWLCCGLLVVLSGCSSWNLLSDRLQGLDDQQPDDSKVRLVGDMAVPFGMFPVEVEAVGLVTGLRGTGSDPAPSAQRAALLDEMQKRGVKNPNTVLGSPNTALVLVRGVLRPGIQKGDHFDVEVRIPSRSDTTSLRGGHLLRTRLQEMALLAGRFREGKLLAFAEGPVMVDPSARESKDKVLLGRGRILGGGLALKSRPLGLVLKPGHQNVFNSSRVAKAVNKRFHTYQKGVKLGAAEAKTNQFVELTVHPMYKGNIARYVRVVRAIALQESTLERTQRLADLKGRLLDPAESATAALQMEAIGADAAEALIEGLRAEAVEVRFYAAEALAYLERREAAEMLGQIASDQPAFRVFALGALSAMNDYVAYEQLCRLLAVPSAETRYGAFRALWTMNPADPLVLGERLGGRFSYHVLDTEGPAMIHVTRNRRPELVMFGQDQHLLTPLAVSAGNQIMVTSCGPEQITVSRYSVGEPDRKRVVSTSADEVIRAIVELGGTYPDVVQALQEAKAAGAVDARLEVDAVPEAGRSYRRIGRGGGSPPKSEGPKLSGGPKLPAGSDGTQASVTAPERGGLDEKSRKTAPDYAPEQQKRHRPGGFFAKMIGWNVN